MLTRAKASKRQGFRPTLREGGRGNERRGQLHPRPSIKSVKETCREELDLYLSMCHDMTIDDVTPTGAGMEAFWAQQVFVLRTMIYVFRQIYGKPNSAGCLENDFCFAGKTLQPSRSMIDHGSIFDAQLMSCCNLRE